MSAYNTTYNFTAILSLFPTQNGDAKSLYMTIIAHLFHSAQKNIFRARYRFLKLKSFNRAAQLQLM